MKYVLCVLFVCFLGCSKEGASVGDALEKYDQFILQTNADSIASMFVEAGMLGEVGAKPVVGRDSIRALLRNFSHFKVLDTKSSPDVILVDDTTAKVDGTFQQTAVVNGDTLHASGEFFSEWVLVDNEWKLTKMLTKSKP